MTPEQIEKKLKRLEKLICCDSGGGEVSSVFGRTGDVVAVAGDYDFSEIGSTPTTLAGYGITDAQPLDSDLTAIAALAADGLLRKTAGTWAMDSATYLTGVNLNQIGAATTTATINNAANAIEWQWNTLAGGNGLLLSSTSTAATGDTQTLFRATLSGSNSTAGQFTMAIAGVNTHTGSTSENVGVYGDASGGTAANYSGYFNGAVSVGGASIVGGATSHALMVRGLDNTAGSGIIVYPNANYVTSTSYGYAGMIASADYFISVIGGDLQLNATQTFVGGVTDPTARLHIAAGSATAGTAPIKLISGTVLTTPEDGAIEYDGTNYFASVSTTRYTLAKVLTNTATLDFGSISAQNSADLTITVTGAAVGDSVALGIPNGSVTANTIFYAWVSASNTVTVRASNIDSVAAADPASGTFRATVIKV